MVPVNLESEITDKIGFRERIFHEFNILEGLLSRSQNVNFGVKIDVFDGLTIKGDIYEAGQLAESERVGHRK